MFKRRLALFLCIVMILTALPACGNHTRGNAETSSDTASQPLSTSTELVLGENEVSLLNYRLVFSSDISYATQQDIKTFAKLIEDETGIDLAPTVESNVPNAEKALEIVVGAAHREEAEAAEAELRADDYLIRYVEETGRILLLGGNADSTQRALSYFVSAFVDLERKTASFPDSGTYYSLAEYTLGEVTLDGVDIREYTVVVPKNADLLTYSAGLNIVDFFSAKMGITLSLVTDNRRETEHEILVGATNRTESAVSCAMEEGQYLLMKSGTKLVLQGHSYMVGGAFGTLVRDYIDVSGVNTKVEITGLPTTAKAETYIFEEEYTNVILMIGDGMGYNQVELAKKNGMDTFVAELLPSLGSAVTRSYSVLQGTASYTDSAAAATALATGYKTTNGRVGQDHTGKEVTNVRELAFRYGAQTAVVTTDTIVGATPASFLGHVNDRSNTTRLYIEIEKLINGGLVDYCQGSTDDLLLHTRRALMEITDAPTPFFAMIEEAHIDKKSHSSDIKGCYDCVVRFNESIAYVIEFVLCHPGTAMIVTADHETGGLTEADEAADVLGSIPDSLETESLLRKIESHIQKYGYSYTAYTGSGSCQHTNANVPVYALGPGTEIFHDTATENIDIARFIAKAYGAEAFGQTEALPPVESS